MPRLSHRPSSSLPATTLPWLSLRDHFVATVGPSAGQGQRLKSLLVLADATFAPGSRFPLHPHREMEILSVVLTGTLSHHGNQAHGANVEARSVQLISARDGMVHAEGNDTAASTRMLQLWFEPSTHGGPPQYFNRTLSGTGRQWVAGDATLPLRADARVFWVDVDSGGTEHFEVASGRAGYLLAMLGQAEVSVDRTSRVSLAQGDGLVLEQGAIEVRAASASALLWVDVA